ncbi:tight adherence pilus pseudopilin TadF [Candidatus Sodalis endolongispinus]|nr:tight adherence pilus pseudopilin TadF [Candidatus Sodalis endolongispinus]
MIGIVLIYMTFIAVSIYTQGKLDRLSYSLAGILRERSVLYPRHQRLTSADVDDLYAIAKGVLHDMNSSVDSSNLTIKAEEIYFPRETALNSVHSNRAALAAGNGNPIYTSYRAGKGDDTCESSIERTTLENLSPTTPQDGKIPIYQVTVCYSVDIGQALPKLGNITSHAIAVAR